MRMHRWLKAGRAAAAPDHRDVSRSCERQHEQARRAHDGAAVAVAAPLTLDAQQAKLTLRPTSRRATGGGGSEVAWQRVGARIGALGPEQREQGEGPRRVLGGPGPVVRALAEPKIANQIPHSRTSIFRLNEAGP